MAGIPYYTIVPCCSSSGTVLGYFNFPTLLGANGTYVYNGPTTVINGLTFTDGFCYTITGIGVSLTTYPVAPANANFNLVTTCSDSLCYDCESPLPLPKCFNLYSCDGDVIITDSDLTLYQNTFVSLVGITGCWYVSTTTIETCHSPNTQKVNVDPDVPCTCECKCYQVTDDPTSIYYVDCDLVEHTVTGTTKFCSVIPPIVTGGITGDIYDFGLCVNGECTELCFQFRNCQTGEILVVSNTPQITQYFVDQSIVTLMGHDGCWSIELSETCECPINVTILQVYSNCTECLPTVAYQFTNCNNSSIVQYSTDDYSAYVGKSVILACGECWSVSQVDFIPPAIQPIQIQYVYDSCTACNRTYYKLTDCANISNVQYTYSNLADYLGKVVKLENCDGCFSVEETKVPINAGIVTVTESFVDCVTCGAIAPCICTTIKNYDTVVKTYRYIDCNGTLQTLILNPNEKSDKICMRDFVGDNLCNCIDLTIDGKTVTAFLQAQEVNGKPTWVFQYNSASFNIVYDVNEGWQILTSDTIPELVAELNNPMLPCPSGPWTTVLNKAINIAVYLDDSTLLLQGNLIYDSSNQVYFGNISNGTDTYQFVLDVTYFSECNGVWQLAYYNSSLPIPAWETIVTWPADCTCLSGTYTNTTPDITYVVIQGMCAINTDNCSNGYETFIPSSTDDIEQYGDCNTASTECYTYIITIPALPQSQTLHYKDCTGSEITEVFPISKASVVRNICGIPNQTSADIYMTGSTVITFEQTIICSPAVYKCPVPNYPKRSVKPGYNVPSCSPEKYEKYACKSSEILYKTVMQKRYGISNCCPDTDLGDQWLVKKELADLQGAMDPNYVCTPVSSCCNNTPTCGCGCNSTVKTCNSR